MCGRGQIICGLLAILACSALAQQGYYREVYTNIAGNAVANLTAAPAFPSAPAAEDVADGVLETPSNFADNYGQRVRAVLTAPASATNYLFWIASDDASELWLGTNASPGSKRRIAYVSGWTAPRVWTSSVTQCSGPVSLAAGARYYLEALHKEGGGGDNLAVAWLVPGSGVTSVIPASALQPWLEAPAVKTHPASVEIYEQWAGVSNVSFSVEAVRKGGMTYQWQLDGAPIAGATQPVYTCLADVARSNRLFRCALASLGGAVTSQTARYQFVPDRVPPAFLRWSLSHDRRTLTLVFDEPLQAESVSNAAFSVSGTQVLHATRLDDGVTVALRLADPLAAGAARSLSLRVLDSAQPGNLLALDGYALDPPALAPVPTALLRGEVEPSGPSSRRSPLALTEIHHTPAARADGRDVRFVELYNSNPFPQDVGGYRFSGAFDYTVPSGTVMAANGYLVVAPAPADVAAEYGLSGVLGGFDAAALDGTSEIELHDELGAWLTTVAYADEAPWPVAADGAGHSLVLARPSYGEREADGWSASARLGGSPGADEPARPEAYAAVLLNELLAHTAEAPGFVELHNASTAAVSLAGCVIRQGSPSSAGFTLPEGTVLAGGGYLCLDEAALGFKLNGLAGALWLAAPGGEVIDAVKLDDQESGVSSGRFPDAGGNWCRLEAPSPAAANAPRRAAEVVINEIMYQPISEDSGEEYVELHNPGGAAVSLAGWKLAGGISYAFTETIPAGGFLVVARDRAKLAALYPGLGAQLAAGEYDGSLGNSRDTVALSKPVAVMDTTLPEAPALTWKNTVVEQVTYRDGGEWAALADGGGSALERVDPRADPGFARSWAASDETQKSGWVTLAFTGAIDNGFTASANGDPNAVTIGLMDAGECLVDAVEVKAAGGANLVSNPSFEAGTNFWRFMGTHDRSEVAADAAAPDGGSVLRLRAGDRCHNSMNICRGLLSATLPKSGTGTVSVRARWLAGCPELLVRTRGSWLEAAGNILTTRALGSPGQANSRARANGAPALADVLHQPLLPRNGERVTVFARAQDPDGVSSCTLYYRVEGLAGTNAVAMAPAAAGYFAGELPAGLPANALVAFWVEAADGHAQTARVRFPSALSRECLVRFNEPLDSRAFGVYRFWMTKENIAYWGSREKASNQPVDATFVYGTNRVCYRAGMMYAGSPFHSGYAAPINPGANIDYEALFESDDRLLDDDGIVLSTIGNLGSDTIAVREQFCYSLVHALKIPHMYRRYIHLYANGVEQSPKKIYEDTEKPNASALKHWFPEDDDNDFFKVDDWFEHALDLGSFSYTTARLQKYTTPAPDGDGQVLKLGRYRWNWLKRGYRTFEANDYTNFFSLVETLNLADTNTYVQRIQEQLNLADFVPVVAANQFIGNYDSYGYSRGKNMYLYDSADGWQLIAWDLDFNFGSSRPLTEPIDPSLASFPTEDPTMRTLLKTPLATRIFWRAVERLAAAANDPWQLALMRAKYDALKADATNLTGDYNAFLTAVETRRTNVVAQLAAAQPAGFAVLSPAGPVSTATNNLLTLSGLAPFGVTAVLVNGAEVPVTWTSATAWTAQVVLNGGTNALHVTALAEDGRPYPGGSSSLSVVYAGAPLDPLEACLTITEIMAVPATNGAAYVEVANRSGSTLVNLSGLTLGGSVSFTFPAGTVLEPGACAVVAADRGAFAAAYGTSTAARVAGEYAGALGAAQGRVALKRPAAGFETDDVVLDEVAYEHAYPWPEPAAGVSLQLINPALDNNRVANWASQTNTGSSVTVAAVPWGQTWRYTPAGYPGDAWADATFTDAGWASGAGPLGYETAALPVPLATSFALTGRPSYYFRTSFVFDGDPAAATLALTYMLDDAAVFYLNGQELHRSSLMPLGPLTDASVATAAKMPEGQIEGPFSLPATALRPGLNLLAVRVLQNQSASSDLVFGMKLEITSVLSSTATPGERNSPNATLSSLPAVWLNELQPSNVSGPADGQGEREPWAELYNAGTSSVSLAGWALATGPADAGWAFPSNAALAAKGYLRVWLDGEPAESGEGQLHAGFRWAETNALLVLRAPVDGRPVAADYLRVSGAAADAAWGAYPDGASNPRRWLNPSTPAAANRVDRPACRVVVNEISAQNDLFTNPLTGKKDDWFELFNDGTAAVDLTGFVVTDTLLSEEPPVPDLRASKSLVISNGVTLLPGQALRIWTGASKTYLLPFDPANLQAPFGLNKEGDQVCLFSPALQLMDRLSFAGEHAATASVGRWANGAEGERVTFAQPTPGAPNRNPRFGPAVLAQPPAFALREERPFCHTNAFAGARPEGFEFRLYPAAGGAVPANLSCDSGSGVLAWTPTEAQGPGLYVLRVCGFLVDGVSVTACDEVLLTLSVQEVPSAPVLAALPALTVSEGSPASFTVAAARAEEIPPYPTLTTLRVEPLPTNATFDAASGVFRWNTGERDGPSTNLFTVVAEDASDPGVFASAVVTVRVNEVNSPLVYQSPGTFYLWHNEPFEAQLRYADADWPPNRLTYLLVSGPPGMALDAEQGTLRWQPEAGQTGSFSVRFRTFDNAGSALTTTVTLWVDSASLLATAFSRTGAENAFGLQWGSKPGAFYTVEWRDDLSAGAWRALNADAPLAGTGGTLSWTFDPAAVGSPPRAFFRVRQTR